MTTLRVPAPGKVNLCLFLGAVRADGRHELVTLFESVSLADELLVSPADADLVVCPGVEGPNLVAGALERLRSRGWAGPPVRIEIVKRIPVAAGMGGGSADAAAMLRVAPELAPLGLATAVAIAAELGADVPSQLVPGLALGTGAGEIVETRDPLPPHGLLILPSGHALGTAEVYREADRLGLGRPAGELEALRAELDAALGGGAGIPRPLLVNDLEPAALSLCPSIGDAFAAARESGAPEALVCGSGPTVAGVFWGPDGPRQAAEAASALQSRYPGVVAATPVRPDFGMPRIA